MLQSLNQSHAASAVMSSGVNLSHLNQTRNHSPVMSAASKTWKLSEKKTTAGSLHASHDRSQGMCAVKLLHMRLI
ncbi:hypothetical protein ACOMHN_010828 [Nucella lapillus]